MASQLLAATVRIGSIVEPTPTSTSRRQTNGSKPWRLGLTDGEMAFYDALADHEGVRDVMGDDTLKIIAHELVDAVRRSVTIDWTVRENARAQIRVIVKRILRKYGYPPDKQEKATETVLEQAALMCREMAA